MTPVLGTGRPTCRRPSRARQEKQYTIYNIHRNFLSKYEEGGDMTSQYSYLVVGLSNWVPNNWVFCFPTSLADQSFPKSWLALGRVALIFTRLTFMTSAQTSFSVRGEALAGLSRYSANGWHRFFWRRSDAAAPRRGVLPIAPDP